MDGLAQLMHVELAGIDDRIGQPADGRQALPFPADAGRDALVRAQRMRTARLAEAPDQRRIVGFEEKQPRGNLAADALVTGRESASSAAPSRMSTTMRRAADVRARLGQLGEFRDQVDGKIVDRIVAEVLERLEHGAFAGAAQAGDNHQLGFRTRGFTFGRARAIVGAPQWVRGPSLTILFD